MIYNFGDSYTWGWNFFIDSELKDKRTELIYGSVVSKKLNIDLVDYSLPASSNWRIARLLQSINLTSNDIVLIGFTSPTRFEFGLADDYDIEPNHPDIHYRITDMNEDHNGVRTKRMSYHLMDRTTCQFAKQFMWSAYGPFNSEIWFKEMFKVMFHSCLHILEKSKCKFLMYDVWCQQCDDNLFTDINNYIFRGTHLLNAVRDIPGYITDKDYLDVTEHNKIADMLIERL